MTSTARCSCGWTITGPAAAVTDAAWTHAALGPGHVIRGHLHPHPEPDPPSHP